MPAAPNSPAPTHRMKSVFRAIVVAGAVGCAGYYTYAGWQQTAHADAPCGSAIELSKKIAPLATGEVAALTMATKPLQLPDIAFTDGAGAPKKLSDFRGKTVLLNLWATWCVPCRKEMPALNNLQTKLGSDNFQVVAVNIDTRDPEKPKAFLADAKLTALDVFTDRSAKVFQELKSVGRALGMPTSVLVDGAGCEIATIAGPAEWDSPDAVKLLEAAVKK